MVKTNKLQGKMKEHGYTIQSLADEINVSRATLFNKIHNVTEFSAGEIMEIGKILMLNYVEIQKIFFAKESDLKSTNL